MSHPQSEHPEHPDLQARALDLLPALKREAVSRGRTAGDVESSRRMMRKQGRSASSIAACEFAELRLFDDLYGESAQVRDAALAGTPSEVTLAYAERDGYCMACVRSWFASFAQAYRAEFGSPDVPQ